MRGKECDFSIKAISYRAAGSHLVGMQRLSCELLHIWGMYLAVSNIVALVYHISMLHPEELDNICGFLLSYKSIWPDPKLLSKIMVSVSKLKELILISLKFLAS